MTQLAQQHLRAAVRAGDLCVDATLGNGHDTLFLAELVGENGHVHAFDIQAQALAVSEEKLRLAGASERVTLHLCGHEKIAETVVEPVRAVMFNLGYLPSGDHAIITRPETTLQALDAALSLLKSGGLLSVVCYPGHSGGDREAEAVLAWARQVEGAEFQLLETPEKNASFHDAKPFLILIQRKK